MPTFDAELRLISDARAAGATHLLIAWSWAAADGYYPIHVRPGQDAVAVAAAVRDPLVACYALQHPQLPLDAQLGEYRPWHLDPAPTRPAPSGTPGQPVRGMRLEDLPPPDPSTRRTGRAAPVNAAVDISDGPALSGAMDDHHHGSAGAEARVVDGAAAVLRSSSGWTRREVGGPPSSPAEVVSGQALRIARHEFEQVRSWTFSPANRNADYSRYDNARSRLVAMAGAAYRQGQIPRSTVQRIAGLSREEVTGPHPGRVSAAGAGRGAEATPAGRGTGVQW